MLKLEEDEGNTGWETDGENMGYRKKSRYWHVVLHVQKVLDSHYVAEQ